MVNRIAISVVAVGLMACVRKDPYTVPKAVEPPHPPAPAPTLATDAPMDCMSTVEDSKPGNVDRFKFEAKGGLFGFKNGNGDVVIQPTFRFAYEFKPGGIAAAVTSDAKFVFIDPSGKTIARAYAFDNGPDYFQEGMARIIDDNKKIGFISDRGIVMIKPRYDAAESFCSGAAKVEEGGTSSYINRLGQPTKAPPPEDRD